MAELSCVVSAANCQTIWLEIAQNNLSQLPQPRRGPKRDNSVLAQKYFDIVSTELLLNNRRHDQIILEIYHIRRDRIKRKLGKFVQNNKTIYWLDWFEQQPCSLYRVVQTGSNMREENTQVKLIWEFLSDLELESVPVEAIIEHYQQHTGDLTTTPIDTRSLKLYIERTRESIKTKTRWSTRQKRMVHAYPDWIATAQDNLKKAVQILRLTNNGYLDQPMKFSEFGRLYLGGVNLQSCSKTVRHAALGHCYSIDFSVCSSAWRLYTAQQIDKEFTAPHTLRLIKDKQQFRWDLAAVLDERHTANAKRILTAIGFGADMDKQAWPMKNGEPGIPAIKKGLNPEQISSLEECVWFNEYLLEQHTMSDMIAQHSMRDLKREEVQDCVRDAGGRIQRNKVLAFLYQHAEMEYLTDLMDYITQRFGRDEILLTTHDCVYIKHSVNMAEVNSRLCYLNPYLSAEITEHWGHFTQNTDATQTLDPHKQQAENFLNYWRDGVRARPEGFYG
jgi:hypothetical protein